MKLKKIIFTVLGVLCLCIGTVGIILPVVPTVPLYLATVFFFANSSERLHNWFKSTGLYKRHLESYVKKEGLMLKTKLNIALSITLVIGISVFFVNILLVRIILAVVWLGLMIYFFFCVKTVKMPKNKKDDAEQQ